jgi:hypothetical protein
LSQWIRGRLSHKLWWLDTGQIAKLVSAIRAAVERYPEAADAIRMEANYRQELLVGSGVIEAGSKTVIAARLKRSGMFWTVRGANAIIALRRNRISARFEDYWSTRQETA